MCVCVCLFEYEHLWVYTHLFMDACVVCVCVCLCTHTHIHLIHTQGSALEGNLTGRKWKKQIRFPNFSTLYVSVSVSIT